MAVRQNALNRVETPELQGEGSYVLLRKLSWGRIQEARRIQALNGGAGEGTGAPAAELVQADIQYTEDVLTEGVAGWDWVDDEGKPLPLPADGGIPLLAIDEVQFLLKTLFNPAPEQTKN